MQTVITSKFQTTIPKKVREQLHLSVHDALDWQVDQGKIVVSPVKANFLEFQNSIKVGPGEIKNDILLARQQRLKKYK
ncbi:MAG: AbrB/MazE/SpoVT family DNA-binding domain-containing protein [Desulfobulbaceae bacterium]|nr:AbrB/MazE/SpoVT family DNA-binding domain-containing protein [Desulfobulbaceae bacterium]